MNQEQPSMSPARPAVSKWLWIVLLIVLVLGAGFFAWYYLMGPGKTVATTTTTPVTTTTPTASTSGTTATTGSTATADWETYASSINGYSIKYPTAYVEKDVSTTMANFNESSATNAPLVLAIGVDKSITSIDTTQSLDDIITQMTTNNLTKDAVKTTLASQPAYEVANNGPDQNNYIVVAKANNHLYQLNFYISGTPVSGTTYTAAQLKAKLSDNQKNMLSTFTFTK